MHGAIWGGCGTFWQWALVGLWGVLLKVTPSSQPLPFALFPVHHEGKFPLLDSCNCGFLPKSMGLRDRGPSDLKLWFKEIFPTKVVSPGYFGIKSMQKSLVQAVTCYEYIVIYIYLHWICIMYMCNVYLHTFNMYVCKICICNINLKSTYLWYMYINVVCYFYIDILS